MVKLRIRGQEYFRLQYFNDLSSKVLKTDKLNSSDWNVIQSIQQNSQIPLTLSIRIFKNQICNPNSQFYSDLIEYANLLRE